ncbi:hypothetical protein L195_g020010 [Trifolium pratense]|uniref:Uncharacterized protein n=1 Tax=Trifolium pratense TaxID=57577 RepID=A0A2K3N1A9_TRIPR|nr:hypothetical protein L195_g020010 [Trifolium pratense]
MGIANRPTEVNTLTGKAEAYRQMDCNSETGNGFYLFLKHNIASAAQLQLPIIDPTIKYLSIRARSRGPRCIHMAPLALPQKTRVKNYPRACMISSGPISKSLYYISANTQEGEIIAKLIAVGTTCVDAPSPIQGWTSLGTTKITFGCTQNLDWNVMANGLYQSLDSRISSLEKLKQTETSQQAEATEQAEATA